jgi:hypothetical protein
LILLKRRHIKLILKALYRRINLTNFSFLLKRSNSKKIWIVDLDNTIANTWPLRKKAYDDKRIFQEVRAFEGLLQYLYRNIHSKDLFIILSARPYSYLKITKKWIRSCFSGTLNPKVFLVEAPLHKLKYIELSIKHGFKVIYMDDLSYNHENDDVRFYQEVIDKVNKLPIKHIGYEEILKLQK